MTDTSTAGAAAAKDDKDDKGAGAAGAAGGNGAAAGGGGKGGDPDDLEGLREALRKEREEKRQTAAQLREAQAKASKLDELENANKDEVTKAREALAKAEEQATTATRRTWQLEAALEAGLPKKFAARLVGDDYDAMLADAKELAEELGTTTRRRDTARTGDAGAGGTGPGETMDDLIRARAGRR